jgi:hypothetical protein
MAAASADVDGGEATVTETRRGRVGSRRQLARRFLAKKFGSGTNGHARDVRKDIVCVVVSGAPALCSVNDWFAPSRRYSPSFACDFAFVLPGPLAEYQRRWAVRSLKMDVSY